MNTLKFLVFFIACICFHPAFAQDRYRTSSGVLQIDASTPFEDIRAQNEQVNAVLNPHTGEIAVLLLNKELAFRNRLMEEHFNENYMESDKFPKSVFTGNLRDFSMDKLGPESEKFNLIGELNIHGVSRRLDTWVGITRKAEGIELSFSFTVKTEDHKIKVPKLLFKKIAQEVNVTGTLPLTPVTK